MYHLSSPFTGTWARQIDLLPSEWREHAPVPQGTWVWVSSKPPFLSLTKRDNCLKLIVQVSAMITSPFHILQNVSKTKGYQTPFFEPSFIIFNFPFKAKKPGPVFQEHCLTMSHQLSFATSIHWMIQWFARQSSSLLCNLTLHVIWFNAQTESFSLVLTFLLFLFLWLVFAVFVFLCETRGTEPIIAGII